MPVTKSNSAGRSTDLNAVKSSQYQRKKLDESEGLFVEQTYIIALLILSVVLVFGQVMWHEFIDFDDNKYAYANPMIKAGLSIKSITWAFTTFEMGHWHPLTWLSLLIDYQLFGMRPGGFHFTNLLLHLITTLLLYYFFRKASGEQWLSAMVALLFAIHPLHVEPVAWIASRKDLLSMLFCALTLTSYYYYTEKISSWKRYLLVCLMFLLGLMSKSMLISVPLILLLLDYWPLRRYQDVIDQNYRAITAKFLRLCREKLPLFILSAGAAMVAFYANRSMVISQRAQRQFYMPPETLPDNSAVYRVIDAYGYYILKLCWPFDLAIIHPPILNFSLMQIIPAAFLLFAVTVYVLYRIRKDPYLFTGWCWYLITLLPVANLLLADRYTYLPYTGLFIMIVWKLKAQLSAWHSHQTLIKWAGGTLLILLAGCAFIQTDNWRDSVTIFQNAISVTEQNPRAHLLLGQTYYRLGKLDDAVKEYREFIKLKPDHAEIHFNLAQILTKQGKIDEAINAYNESLRCNPNLAKSHYSLGKLLAAQGRTAESISHLEEAVRLEPDSFGEKNLMR